MVYRNRTEAGRRLGGALAAYADRADVLVLALPRAGVPGGFDVAAALNAPLDVFVVRKRGVPSPEEPAFGAIASESFHGVGEWYDDFSQTSDEEVRALLAQALLAQASRSHLNPPPFVA